MIRTDRGGDGRRRRRAGPGDRQTSRSPGWPAVIGCRRPPPSPSRRSGPGRRPDGADRPEDTFPDALAGNYSGGLAQRPAPPDHVTSLSGTTRTAITVLGGSGRRSVLGGTTAVAESVADELRNMGLVVSRVAGADRSATAAQLALAAGPAAVGRNENTPAHAPVLSSGINFPDALAAGPMVYRQHFPQLLTGPGPSRRSPARTPARPRHRARDHHRRRPRRGRRHGDRAGPGRHHQRGAHRRHHPLHHRPRPDQQGDRPPSTSASTTSTSPPARTSPTPSPVGPTAAGDPVADPARAASAPTRRRLRRRVRHPPVRSPAVTASATPSAGPGALSDAHARRHHGVRAAGRPGHQPRPGRAGRRPAPTSTRSSTSTDDTVRVVTYDGLDLLRRRQRQPCRSRRSRRTSSPGDDVSYADDVTAGQPRHPRSPTGWSTEGLVGNVNTGANRPLASHRQPGHRRPGRRVRCAWAEAGDALLVDSGERRPRRLRGEPQRGRHHRHRPRRRQPDPPRRHQRHAPPGRSPPARRPTAELRHLQRRRRLRRRAGDRAEHRVPRPSRAAAGRRSRPTGSTASPALDFLQFAVDLSVGDTISVGARSSPARRRRRSTLTNVTPVAFSRAGQQLPQHRRGSGPVGPVG